MVLPCFANGETIDEKRLKAFQLYVHKKEAHEAARERYADREKLGRGQREQRYEKVRESFRRPTTTKPPGEDGYQRRREEMAARYAQTRDTFAERRQRLAEMLDAKIDRTKMIEYELKN